MQQTKTSTPTPVQPGLESTFHDVPLADLREQIDLLRADRDRLLDQQRRIADLIGAKNPDKLLHDLRNLLNELQLYKTLVEMQSNGG